MPTRPHDDEQIEVVARFTAAKRRDLVDGDGQEVIHRHPIEPPGRREIGRVVEGQIDLHEPMIRVGIALQHVLDDCAALDRSVDREPRRRQGALQTAFVDAPIEVRGVSGEQVQVV